MRGCLTLILLIIVIALLINFPLVMIGIVILFWGIYEYNINKQLKAKSKLIPVIISFGLILSIFGCSIGSSNDEKKDSNDVKTVEKDQKTNDDKAAEKAKSNDDSKEKDKVAIVKQTKNKSTSSKNLIPVKLIETVDGDTIKVNYKGKEEIVRYLLVDTPESKKPGVCVQPFAKSAYNKNKQLLNSGKLSLEFESSAKRDKYDRLLAYVYVDGKSVQESLLKGGYARVAYIYDPPYKHLSQYQKDETIAKSKDLNIWSKSGFVTDRGFNGCASSTTKKSTSNGKKSYNSNSTGSSGSSSSASTNSSTTSSSGAEYFANCTELRTKYPNGVPSTHPAYQSKMDRDHDNYACERY